MPEKPRFKFSHTFRDPIWSVLHVPGTTLMALELRNNKDFQVEFSILDFSSGKFLWENLKLKESWWCGFTAANSKTILFHIYSNKGNPDHKNLIAYDIFNKKIRWEVSEFSFFDWDASRIFGYRTVEDLKPAVISIASGNVVEENWEAVPVATDESLPKPALYSEGSAHFETVRKFVQDRTDYAIVRGAEYLEWNNRIIISGYVERDGKLANYLFVFSDEGQLLMEEKLCENLTGLGTDTFFMLSGCLILIKNKSELVAYAL